MVLLGVLDDIVVFVPSRGPGMEEILNPSSIRPHYAGDILILNSDSTQSSNPQLLALDPCVRLFSLCLLPCFVCLWDLWSPCWFLGHWSGCRSCFHWWLQRAPFLWCFCYRGFCYYIGLPWTVQPPTLPSVNPNEKGGSSSARSQVGSPDMQAMPPRAVFPSCHLPLSQLPIATLSRLPASFFSHPLAWVFGRVPWEGWGGCCHGTYQISNSGATPIILYWNAILSDPCLQVLNSWWVICRWWLIVPTICIPLFSERGFLLSACCWHWISDFRICH